MFSIALVSHTMTMQELHPNMVHHITLSDETLNNGDLRVPSPKDCSSKIDSTKLGGGKVRESRGSGRRTVFTKRQLTSLESRFILQSFLSREERKELADQLKLTERQVMIWFQNRRGRLKRRGPSDSAYNPVKLSELNQHRPYPFLYGVLSSNHTQHPSANQHVWSICPETVHQPNHNHYTNQVIKPDRYSPDMGLMPQHPLTQRSDVMSCITNTIQTNTSPLNPSSYVSGPEETSGKQQHFSNIYHHMPSHYPTLQRRINNNYDMTKHYPETVYDKYSYEQLQNQNHSQLPARNHLETNDYIEQSANYFPQTMSNDLSYTYSMAAEYMNNFSEVKHLSDNFPSYYYGCTV